MIDRKLLFGLSLVLLSTTYDLTQLYSNNVSAENESGKSTEEYSNRQSDEIYEQTSTIPPPKIKTSTAPTIKFLYCSS